MQTLTGIQTLAGAHTPTGSPPGTATGYIPAATPSPVYPTGSPQGTPDSPPYTVAQSAEQPGTPAGSASPGFNEWKTQEGLHGSTPPTPDASLPEPVWESPTQGEEEIPQRGGVKISILDKDKEKADREDESVFSEINNTDVLDIPEEDKNKRTLKLALD